MTSISTPARDRLVASSQIGNVLSLHSRGADRADASMVAKAYHPGATVDYGFFAGQASEFAAVLTRDGSTASTTQHRTAAPLIHLKENEAVSEAYSLAYIAASSIQRLIFGRYLDRLERREGEWRITHRQFVMDGNVNRTEASIPTSLAPSANFVPIGTKGASDPSLVLLAHHHASSLVRQGAAPMTLDDAALDQALSHLAIHELVMTYCRGMDRADAALLASIFWEDSTVVSGIVNASGPEFAERICTFCTANLDYCFHSIANEWIEVKGDHAVGEHYLIAHSSAGGQDVLAGGRYLDRYERRDRIWKIASRTFIADWNSIHPASMALDGVYEPLKTRGAFGHDDPVYAHWASL